MHRALAMIFLTACGASDGPPPRSVEARATRDEDRAVATPEGTDPEQDEPSPLASCPATFGTEAPVSCAASAPLRCEYVEGACECVIRAYCRGVPPGPDDAPEWAYRCTPTRRADGCPGAAPEEASACDQSMTCAYPPDCCGVGIRAACVEGSWSIEHFPVSCPPSRPPR
jgi:hypothetical protein